MSENTNPLGLTEPESYLKRLSVSTIRESANALRSVQRDTEKYSDLVDNVAQYGVLQPILVREDTDPDTSQQFFWLIDGLQRFNACKDSGREFIDAKVVTMDANAVMEAQIITNIQRIETTPVQYSEQLKRIMAGNPTMTVPSLAAKLNRSVTWVSDRLGLLKLTKEIGELVDAGKINMMSAYALAKLPPDEQRDFVERAMTLQPQEFCPAVNTRVKELKEAKKQGRQPGAAEFVPVAHMQKLAVLKEELSNPKIAHVLVNHTGTKSPIEGFNLGVAWSLHQDPLSLQTARDAETARLKKIADAKIQRDEARAAKTREKILNETSAVAAA